MRLYKITESVSGETLVVSARSVELALITFILKMADTNPDSESWNYDFEITLVEES